MNEDLHRTIANIATRYSSTPEEYLALEKDLLLLVQSVRLDTCKSICAHKIDPYAYQTTARKAMSYMISDGAHQ